MTVQSQSVLLERLEVLLQVSLQLLVAGQPASTLFQFQSFELLQLFIRELVELVQFRLQRNKPTTNLLELAEDACSVVHARLQKLLGVLHFPTDFLELPARLLDDCGGRLFQAGFL